MSNEQLALGSDEEWYDAFDEDMDGMLTYRQDIAARIRAANTRKDAAELRALSSLAFEFDRQFRTYQVDSKVAEDTLYLLQRRTNARRLFIIGLSFFALGTLGSWITYWNATMEGGQYVIWYGPAIFGLLIMVRSIYVWVTSGRQLEWVTKNDPDLIIPD